jgi:hypothetical protein
MPNVIKEYEQLLAKSCSSNGADGVPNAAVITADANGQSSDNFYLKQFLMYSARQDSSQLCFWQRDTFKPFQRGINNRSWCRRFTHHS